MPANETSPRHAPARGVEFEGCGRAVALPDKIDEGFRQLAEQIEQLCSKLTGWNPPRVANSETPLDLKLDHCCRSLGELNASADQLRERLARAETRNFEQGLQLKARSEESRSDPLTGLANRRDFDQRFEQRSINAQATNCPLVVAILDIDHFKMVNDTRGHHAGDAVLRGVARIIAAHLPSDALAARLGGEEFVVLLSGAYIDQAIEVIEQLRIQINRTQFRFEGQPLNVTVSCGLAQLDPNEHHQQFLQRADVAMYAAKQGGRNQTSWHDGQTIHRVAQLLLPQVANSESRSVPIVVDLNSVERDKAPGEAIAGGSLMSPRSMRAIWCDGAMVFWFIRQRLAEFRRGGEPFCVLAIDVDDTAHISQHYGTVALHFMMRAQVLHLDAIFREMDVIARTCRSRVIVVLPMTRIVGVRPLIERMRETMDRFAYPGTTGLLEYSISGGVTEIVETDDAQQVVQRAEQALALAHAHGSGRFYATDGTGTWNVLETNATPQQPHHGAIEAAR